MKTYRGSLAGGIPNRLNDYIQYTEIKRLVDNVMILQRQKPFRSLAVLSFFSGEGKTLFAAATAMLYCQAAEARVLLVDTTTVQNPRSLSLRDCLDPSYPMIDYSSLTDHRKGSNGVHPPHQEHTPEPAPLDVEVVNRLPSSLLIQKESDQSLITKLLDERVSQYGLVLVDTAPIAVQNKNNIDPLVAARLCDASVLVVSPQLLQAPNMENLLKVARDPLLHLIGVISNEEAFQ